MKTIRSILEELVVQETGMDRVVARMLWNNMGQEHIDQALAEINKDYISKEEVLKIIDKCKPDLKKPTLGFGDNSVIALTVDDYSYNKSADEYQSNLHKALGKE